MALITGIAIVHTTGMPVDYSFDLDNNYFVVEKGKTETFIFETNGYTDDLLLKNGDEPLNFVIIISDSNKNMYSSFIYNLPNLNYLSMDDELGHINLIELKWIKHKQ